jgi:hypothetical protein
MNAQVRFTKVKVNKDGKVCLTYQKMNEKSEWDDYSMSCQAEAAPTFYRALKNMATYVVEMCELPEDYINRLMVFSVSLSYAGPADTLGAVISSKIALVKSNCPLILNSPHKTETPYSGAEPDEADPAALLPEGCNEAIALLCTEAEEYLNGKRAQTELVDTTTGEIITKEKKKSKQP